MKSITKGEAFPKVNLMCVPCVIKGALMWYHDSTTDSTYQSSNTIAPGSWCGAINAQSRPTYFLFFSPLAIDMLGKVVIPIIPFRSATYNFIYG